MLAFRRYSARAPQWLLTTLATLATLASAACTAQVEPVAARQTFVGELADHSARLAVVVSGALAEGYVCGKDATLATHTGWLKGEAHDATVRLDGADLSLAAQLGSSKLIGRLTLPSGASVDATLHEVAPSSIEGLYDALRPGCRAGVIVWNAEPCQAQGSACDSDGKPEQVMPVTCQPQAPIEVSAIQDGQVQRFTVEAVIPSAP